MLYDQKHTIPAAPTAPGVLNRARSTPPEPFLSRLLISLREPLMGYPMAIVMVTSAAVITEILYEPLFTRNPFALFYGAVVLTAWVWGMGAGLLASGLAVMAIHYLLMPSFSATLTDGAVQVSAFGVVALLVASLNARRRRAERDLRQAKEVAEAANTAKDQFLAMLSHELRTPLTPVLTAAEVLQADETLPDEVRESADMIRRNVALEARLIDDLLDLTRIANGKINLNLQPLDAHHAIDQVLEICRSDLRGKQLKVTLDLEASAKFVAADTARLQQVFWNIIKNATKFTPPHGAITIRTRNLTLMESTTPGTPPTEPRLLIEIQDSGIGIAPEALPKIFDAFEQGERGITRQFGGLGLGLAITKALLDMHGGSLRASSKGKGHGATFAIELPTVPAPAAEPEYPRDPAHDPAVRSVKLLLVEDHPDTARVMSRLLRSWQYDVVTAGSVKAAMASAATERVDLVISDLGLPDGNGIELMNDLRRLYNLKGIALTGHGMEDDVRRCHEAGFHTHLTKPVNIDALRGVIEQVLA